VCLHLLCTTHGNTAARAVVLSAAVMGLLELYYPETEGGGCVGRAGLLQKKMRLKYSPPYYGVKLVRAKDGKEWLARVKARSGKRVRLLGRFATEAEVGAFGAPAARNMKPSH
jgi:hypothetical protein